MNRNPCFDIKQIPRTQPSKTGRLITGKKIGYRGYANPEAAEWKLKGQCHENFVLTETLGVKSRPY